jgi:hypothetical protein
MTDRVRRATAIGCACAALAGAAMIPAASDVSLAAQVPPPDLSGFWAPARGVPPVRALVDRLAPNTVLLNDAGAAEFPRGEFGGLKPRAAALDAALKWTSQDDMVLSKACEPPSIVYSMQGPFPLEIYQGTDLVVFKLEYFDLVRVIFTDGRPHPPPEAPHSKVGHSTGRWEGGTLVVDTTHLSASTITNNGLEHSDRVHVIERFMLDADGRTLLAVQEFDDPDVLENRGARFMAWTRRPGQYVFPYECDPSFAVEFLER